MIKRIFRLTKSALFKGSLLILLSSVIGNFLNYLYHLVTGRMLSPSDYGLLQGFISLTYYQSILVGAFSTGAIEMIGSSRKNKLDVSIRSLERLGLKLSFFLWLVTILFYPLIRSVLRIDNFTLFLVFSFQSLFTFLPSVYGSSLMGRLKFMLSAISSITSTLFKLLTAIILLYLGLGVFGGLGSWVFSGLISLILGGFFVYRLWMKKMPAKIPPIGIGFLKFSILSLIVNLSLTSLYSTDVLLSRYFLGNHQTGIYAATSNLGKIIFFGSTTILTVAFPMFIRFRDRIEDLKPVFWLSFAFILVIGIGGITVFNLFPYLLTRILYGHQYLEASVYLGKFAIFISFLAIFNLLCQYLLSRRSKYSAIFAGLTALMQIVLIIFNHQNIDAIINSSLITIIIGVSIQLLIVLKSINGPKYQEALSYRSGV